MPTTELKYQTGFGNFFETESFPGILPAGKNSPQKVARGLFAEQLSGSSFTAPRVENLRSWLYRIQPALVHLPFQPFAHAAIDGAKTEGPVSPNQMRWDPLPLPTENTDFLKSLVPVVTNGAAEERVGSTAYLYSFNQSMGSTFFYSADGELLFVPELGEILLKTEMGALSVPPGFCAVVPRGVRFQVDPIGPNCRGYVCENFGAPFRLPELGPIGANGLANQRDFETPVAAYEQKLGKFHLVAKFQGALWSAEMDHSPLDVVAWHGNYAPYRYDLDKFNTIGTVSHDHPDPSIFTVLTSPTDTQGVANVDFVIFPPRWMVARDTFRPPYYHRNTMSEFMGLVKGVYDAKPEGFVPGGSSLHNCMSGHGPDAATFEGASNAELNPVYLGGTLAIMFESNRVYRPTKWAMQSKQLQANYYKCWQGLKGTFR